MGRQPGELSVGLGLLRCPEQADRAYGLDQQSATLPNTGFPWLEQRAVDLRCISGADTGVEVTLKVNTIGGVQAVDGLIDTVISRAYGGQHDGKIVPIVLLQNDSYPHVEHRKTWIPVLMIIDWAPLTASGPEA